MIDLNDLSRLKEIDSEDFLSHLESFPEQVALAGKLDGDLSGLTSGEGITDIAVLGMGGSGISGDVVRAVLKPQARVGVTAIKGYDLPRWIGPSTLVFAVSYSGTTEETILTTAEALDRKARVVGVGSGGPLAESAPGLPMLRVPGGLPPRAALGYLVVPILATCERLGLCDVRSALSETISLLERRRERCERNIPVESNPAKQLAQDLFGTVPVVYGSEGVGEIAAYRWKCQFNECSKVLSFSNSFPELDHNELEGWSRGGGPAASSMTVVALRHQGDFGRRGARIDLTLSMIEPCGAKIRQVLGSGRSDLAQLFDLIYMGDFTSAYLALAQGVDPGRIDAIPALKEALGPRGEPGMQGP